MTSETIIYPAKIVRTMDPSRPTATAVAVRDGLIRAVGSIAELSAYPNAVIDERYAELVIVPGFVEAHAHAGSGGMWEGQIYVGYFDRTDPDGNLWPGCTSTEAILDRLREAEAAMVDPLNPLRAWGMDNIYFQATSILLNELDTVSSTRPIQVNHANGHVTVVNSVALAKAGIDASTTTEGVGKYADGTLNGELRELAAMGLVQELFGEGLLALSPTSLRNFARDAVNQGVTTITDLGTMGLLSKEGRATYVDTVDEDFPVRLNVFQFGMGLGTGSLPEATAQTLATVKALGHEKLHFGNVKLMLDGSIQGFTARLLAPGYLGDQPNGMWNTTPEEFEAAFSAFHRHGLLIHVHCNGDEASELFLDTLESVLTKYPRPDHRHTMTHSQLTTQAQYRRAAALGACANIFSNHLWYWGDQHADKILGWDRASRMNATRSALSAGVPISLHCDTPVTELSPLKSMKHAMTRLTPTGRILGEYERLTVEEALHAVTLGAAYMLKMDGKIGSIEAGKHADLAILEQDPYTVAAQDVGTIRVIGTMLGGCHHEAQHAGQVRG
ncbi:amidohydrolase [Arthrobacter sp. MYb227]|uniref:amidohydrolase n=1 Tax=Arthrobacter sp. MYb227 TaxID=1848601 RepID=UPI000CFB3E76|nr:amidohydrolase [Arthrobacter sp. MYb227]PQZ89558.1 amidohydrolase [Arthrobacter sp. MYb227]